MCFSYGPSLFLAGQGSVVAQETQSQEGSLARETRLPILTDAPPSQQPTGISALLA